MQGWVEAMTSLGRLIFFDQPGTGAPIPSRRARCRPWSNGPTASPRCSTISGAAKRSSSRASARCDGGAVRGDTSVAHSRTGRAGGLRESDVNAPRSRTRRDRCRHGRHVGHRRVSACVESGHAVERGDPGSVGAVERLAASPGTVALMMPLVAEMDVRAVLPTVRVPTLVLQHTDDPLSRPRWASTSPITYQARNTLSCRGATCALR